VEHSRPFRTSLEVVRSFKRPKCHAHQERCPLHSDPLLFFPMPFPSFSKFCLRLAGRFHRSPSSVPGGYGNPTDFRRSSVLRADVLAPFRKSSSASQRTSVVLMPSLDLGAPSLLKSSSTCSPFFIVKKQFLDAVRRTSPRGNFARYSTGST